MAALTRNCNAKCGFSTTSAFNSSICDDATAVGGAGSTGVLLEDEDEDELLLESVVSRPDIWFVFLNFGPEKRFFLPPL